MKEFISTFAAVVVVVVLAQHAAVASPLDGSKNEVAPQIESSVDTGSVSPSSREGRQFFFSRTTTITVTAGTVTSTLTTFRSCYSSAPAGIPTCISSVLTGRKKREEEQIQEEMAPAYDEAGNKVDFSKLIAASKVAPQPEEDADDIDRIDEYEQFEPVRVNYETTGKGEPGSNREARFVTYVTTQTVTATSTVTLTTTPLQVATLFFTSVAASQCFPLGLLAAAGVGAC